jgi:hypothetical protein
MRTYRGILAQDTGTPIAIRSLLAVCFVGWFIGFLKRFLFQPFNEPGSGSPRQSS